MNDQKVNAKVRCFVWIFALFFSVNMLQAQQYNLIDPNEEQHFLTPVSNDQGQFDQEIRSIRIDSVQTVGNASIYKNYNFVRLETNLSNGCYAQNSDSSWIGYQVIANPQRQYIFLNHQQDSIYIESQALLNDSWQLLSLDNGAYLEATISQHDTQTIIGVLDSIKTMSIQARDASGTTIAHPMNGKTFSWGKQLGWVTFYNLFDFPLDTVQTYTLIGSSAYPTTLPQPTIPAIFDYAIGDEFHVLETSSTPMGPSSSSSEKFLQKIVLAKATSTNQDTITYTFSICGTHTTFSVANGFDTTYISDTIQEIIALAAYAYLDVLAYETSSDGFGHIRQYKGTALGNLMQISNRNSVMKDGHFPYDSMMQCYPLVTGAGIARNYFVDGLGGPYYQRAETNLMASKYLTYYQKGNETWGTYQNCTHYLSIEEPNKTLTQVQLFPNPVHTTVNLVVKGFELGEQWQLQVVNALGQQVVFRSIEQAQTQISVEGLPAGLYYYQLVAPNARQQHAGQLRVN